MVSTTSFASSTWQVRFSQNGLAWDSGTTHAINTGKMLRNGTLLDVQKRTIPKCYAWPPAFAAQDITTERPPFERIALILQGCGALGAYQAGVYQGQSILIERERIKRQRIAHYKPDEPETLLF
jgi:hypothetical protein